MLTRTETLRLSEGSTLGRFWLLVRCSLTEALQARHATQAMRRSRRHPQAHFHILYSRLATLRDVSGRLE